MIALGGPKLKRKNSLNSLKWFKVSMIALGGPKLKQSAALWSSGRCRFQ